MKIVFFSDAHLNKKDDGRTDYVVRFINDVCQDVDMLVIIGDLFEFYHGYDGYIYPWYKKVIDCLKDLVAKGKRVYFVEGNHEFLMGSFFEKYTGITCMDDLSINIDNKKFLIIHGYQIKSNYLVKVLKTSFIYGIMDMFGPGLTWKIAAISKMFISRRTKPYHKYVMDIHRKFARKKLDDGYAVILAHSHIPDKMECNSGNTIKYYLNTGDIVESATYVEYNTETGFELKKYS